ncbi:MAG: carbon-nitrogen hydrolase family protein, partial [Burkholderiales bacterium]|nr:carbon-nitrogen hydrolase family protein [Burkholderiales bacterium]
RRTWGHSMLIDPWGKIVDVLSDGEGVVSGELDMVLLQGIRENLPALKHRKLV